MERLCFSMLALGVLTLVVPERSAAAAKPVPTWSQQINTPKRFRVLAAFGNAAVLDAETGLVWEQAPSAGASDWSSAQLLCNGSTTGGRRGWRLPTLQELATLVDPNNPDGDPDLSPGHPFSNVSATFYWSATTRADDAGFAWYVDFLDDGDVGFDLKSTTFPRWCVRGGQGVDAQ